MLFYLWTSTLYDLLSTALAETAWKTQAEDMMRQAMEYPLEIADKQMHDEAALPSVP